MKNTRSLVAVSNPLSVPREGVTEGLSRRKLFSWLVGGVVAGIGVAKAGTFVSKSTREVEPGKFSDDVAPAGTGYEFYHSRSVYAYTRKDGDLAFKGFKGKRWVMLVDLRKCIGCQACTAACKFENKYSRGHVSDLGAGRGGGAISLHQACFPSAAVQSLRASLLLLHIGVSRRRDLAAAGWNRCGG